MNKPDDYLAECREIFCYFDSKGDEKINVKQVGDVLRALGQSPTESEVRKCCEQWAEPETRISFEEFVPIFQTVSKTRAQYTKDQFVEGLSHFDREGNGTIAVAELKHLLTNLGCDGLGSDIEDKELSPAYQWCHWGPIFATSIIIIVGLSTSMVHVCWCDLTTLNGGLAFMLFLIWNYLALRYLYLACMLGGGFSKIGWHPDDEEEWENFRYCYRCLAFKAPRVHHCSKCNRCVLLMDHHCPWINGCVGLRNQSCFIKFLFFAIVGCVHAAIVLTSCLYEVIFFFVHNNSADLQQRLLDRPPNLPITSIYLFISSVLSVGLSYGVIIALGILLIVQLRSVYLDRTGIESLKEN